MNKGTFKPSGFQTESQINKQATKGKNTKKTMDSKVITTDQDFFAGEADFR